MLALANYSDSDTNDSNAEQNNENSSKTEETKNNGVCTTTVPAKFDVHKKELKENLGYKSNEETINFSDEEEVLENIRVGESVANNSLSKPVENFYLRENVSSEDDSSSDGSDGVNEEEEVRKIDATLSNPFRDSISSPSDDGESVFQIAFRENEARKAAALERHVKMTAMAGAVQMINGKRMCWNHRKGRCRFGHNCTFAHDTDLPQEDAKRKKT